MTDEDARDPYTRQRRLKEVGQEGQARLAAGRVEIRGQTGAEMERLYLERAGVGELCLLPEEDPPPFRHAALFSHEVAREPAAAAARALTSLKRLLGVGEEAGPRCQAEQAPR